MCSLSAATSVQAAWEREGVQPSEDQVLLREWLPQNDLLGSGRIAVFVTQGGYLSLQVRTPYLCTSLPLTDCARALLGHVPQPSGGLDCSRPISNPKPLGVLEAQPFNVADVSKLLMQAQDFADCLSVCAPFPATHVNDYTHRKQATTVCQSLPSPCLWAKRRSLSLQKTRAGASSCARKLSWRNSTSRCCRH